MPRALAAVLASAILAGCSFIAGPCSLDGDASVLACEPGGLAVVWGGFTVKARRGALEAHR